MNRVRRRSTRVRSGDIFEIPLSDCRLGYGQIIIDGNVLYVAVFRNIYPALPDLDELINSDILLVGWTVDALIQHGDWKIVGNRQPIVDRVPLPSYKVSLNGARYLHDFSGNDRRPATDDEWELLDYKTTVAPIRYQKALLAHHGLVEWLQEYEHLTAEHARRRQFI
jgi:hypothetical protein